MASEDTIVVVMAVVFGLLPTCVLQAVGTFSNHWVSNSTCENIGLKTACCVSTVSTYSSRCVTSDLHPGVGGMHTFAAVVMLCAVIGTGCSFCCEDSDTWFGLCVCAGFCGTLLYPVAGLLSFIACMMLVHKYSGHGYTFGYSYGLCITAAIIVILICVCLISLVCHSKIKKTRAPPPQRPMPPYTPAVTQWPALTMVTSVKRLSIYRKRRFRPPTRKRGSPTFSRWSIFQRWLERSTIEMTSKMAILFVVRVLLET